MTIVVLDPVSGRQIVIQVPQPDEPSVAAALTDPAHRQEMLRA